MGNCPYAEMKSDGKQMDHPSMKSMMGSTKTSNDSFEEVAVIVVE